MKLWVLMENTALDGFESEHGLSLYLQTAGLRILFDAGQSDAFARNAEKLGLDLGKVDLAILSHGHYDHSGGLRHFLELNNHAPIYLSRHAFDPHFNANGKNIGIDPALSSCDRLIFVEEAITIAPGLSLSPLDISACPYPIDSAGLKAAAGTPEDFRHELYLQIREGDKRILISGCSHKGILNIAAHFTPDILIGGFHFKHLPPSDPQLIAAAEELRRHPTTYYTGHCTGCGQFDTMKPILANRLMAIHAGDVFEY